MMRPNKNLAIAMGVAILLAARAFGQSATTKASTPDAAAQKAALDVVVDVYRGDISGADTPAEKSDLARRMIQAAAAITDDPAGRYALLCEARTLAIEATDVPTAMAAVDALADRYAVDVAAMRMATWNELAKSAHLLPGIKALVAALDRPIDAALAADDYQTARNLAALASSSAGRGGDAALLKQTVRRAKEIDAAATAYQLMRPAAAALAANPDDPHANLVVGKFKCLIKGDWEHGLPMLAKGSDPGLKAMADEELAKPDTADKEVEVGDGWKILADSEREPIARQALFQRAENWYRQAIASATNAVDKVKAQAKIDRIEDSLSGPPGSAEPLVDLAGLKSYLWTQDQKDVPLNSTGQSIYFLTSIGGHFQGGGESVHLGAGDDGHMVLSGATQQDALIAEAMSLPLARAGLVDAETSEFTWEQGQEPVKMVRKEDGLCMLCGVSGHFEGGGEHVEITLGADGYWYLSGDSQQQGVAAKAICYQVSHPHSLQYETRQFTWKQGDAPVRMINKNAGFCFLSGMTGRFKEGSEMIQVSVESDGYWYLSGTSAQAGVAASATAIVAPKVVK